MSTVSWLLFSSIISAGPFTYSVTVRNHTLGDTCLPSTFLWLDIFLDFTHLNILFIIIIINTLKQFKEKNKISMFLFYSKTSESGFLSHPFFLRWTVLRLDTRSRLGWFEAAGGNFPAAIERRWRWNAGEQRWPRGFTHGLILTWFLWACRWCRGTELPPCWSGQTGSCEEAAHCWGPGWCRTNCTHTKTHTHTHTHANKQRRNRISAHDRLQIFPLNPSGKKNNNNNNKCLLKSN